MTIIGFHTMNLQKSVYNGQFVEFIKWFNIMFVKVKTCYNNMIFIVINIIVGINIMETYDHNINPYYESAKKFVWRPIQLYYYYDPILCLSKSKLVIII